MNQENSNLEQKKEHPSWIVTFDASGNIRGLPEGISKKNVLIFEGNDGKWYAQNPSPEFLKEIQLWRTDWKNI
jgi:hypothetical protein